MKRLNRHVWAVCLLAGAACTFQPLSVQAQTQTQPQWDDTRAAAWNSAFQVVDIPSEADTRPQKAYLYKATEAGRPLIVSLHTWSGDYRQADPLAEEARKRNYNYIHPDFQGANNHPDAMGSAKVVANLQEAIEYAVKATEADKQEVHVIGVSGGGLAALVAYMNVTCAVKSFSAWAPIADLEAWYWETKGRGLKYAEDIWNATSSKRVFNVEEARRRSPLYQVWPRKQRRGSQLFLYAGVHDGYTGSVPVTHALDMYNRIVAETQYGTTSHAGVHPRASVRPDMVSQDEIIQVLSARGVPHADPDRKLGNRRVYLSRQSGNTQVTLFEGGHEMLPCALDLLPVGGKK